MHLSLSDSHDPVVPSQSQHGWLNAPHSHTPPSQVMFLPHGVAGKAQHGSVAPPHTLLQRRAPSHSIPRPHSSLSQHSSASPPHLLQGVAVGPPLWSHRTPCPHTVRSPQHGALSALQNRHVFPGLHASTPST